MDEMIGITRDDFDVNTMIRKVKRPSDGAIVTFLGVARDDGIDYLEIEAYEEGAVAELESIRNETLDQFHVDSVLIVHRIGRIGIGGNILLVIVGAGHRKEGFTACEYIIDRIKQTVPIWKKETGERGEHWIVG